MLSEEFEDEYSETNRGEIYRVIATVVEIIRIYHNHHAYSTSYEFSGEFKEGNDNRETSIRTLLYYRKAKEIMHPAWDIEIKGNKVVVRREKLQKIHLKIVVFTGAAGLHDIRTIHIHDKNPGASQNHPPE